MFLGSGDLLNRNLERRVEAFIEVKTPDTRTQIRHILDALREDREKSRTMQPDGSYIREENGAGTSSQEALYQYFSKLKVSLDAQKAAPASSSDETRSAGSVPAAPAEAASSAEAVPAAPKPSFFQRLLDFFK